MTPRRNGNVPRRGEDKTQGPPPVFEEGDVVAMTQATLRIGRLQGMSTRLLYTIGWPNEFLVTRSFDDEEDGPCVSLWPCCLPPFGIGLVDRRGSQFRCKGHPTLYFEKVAVTKTPKKGDKLSSIVLPFGIGEILGLEWHEEEEEFVGRILGKEGAVAGALGKYIKKIAESNNLM